MPVIPEATRIRVLMSQFKTTMDSRCERGEPLSAQSAYERMKTLVSEHPDEPDLVAALVDSSFSLLNAYIKDNMPDRAKEVQTDIEKLGARLSRNPKLREQVADFYKKVTGA